MFFFNLWSDLLLTNEKIELAVILSDGFCRRQQNRIQPCENFRYTHGIPYYLRQETVNIRNCKYTYLEKRWKVYTLFRKQATYKHRQLSYISYQNCGCGYFTCYVTSIVHLINFIIYTNFLTKKLTTANSLSIFLEKISGAITYSQYWGM